MRKTYYSSEPTQIVYLPQESGLAEVYLRKNIKQTDEGWCADEVQIYTRLSEEEVFNQIDIYFVEDITPTVDDLVEAINILTDIVLEV